MLVEIIEVALASASKKFFETGIEKVLDKATDEITEESTKIFHKLVAEPRDVAKRLEQHILERSDWCRKIFHTGMIDTVSTSSVFVPLEFNTDPRHQRMGENNDTVELSQLSEIDRNIIILGDIGSGKTTCLKKFALDSLEKKKSFIFIRLRDLGNNANLVSEIMSILGISTRNERPVDKETKEVKQEYQFGNSGFEEQEVNALKALLNDMKVELFLDGFDELPHESRTATLNQIESLGTQSSGLKIYLTSRPTEIRRAMSDFRTYEVEPMTSIAVEELSLSWLSEASIDHKKFLRALAKKAYKDLADRPLMLTNLLILYRKYRKLPQQSVSIYEKILMLCLEEWDASEGLERPTRYSQLEDRRKRDFLANFAFELVRINNGKLSFSSRVCQKTYVRIHRKFGLPEGEFAQVAREIQSTTGIITQSGYDLFEFSHKSIFEYLIGEYLVRAGFEPSAYRVMKSCPNETAIAVALSTSPNFWLQRVFCDDSKFIEYDSEWVEVFVSRILREQPSFVPSVDLGAIFVYIGYLITRQKSKYSLNSLISNSTFRKSVESYFTAPEMLQLNASYQLHVYLDQGKKDKLLGFSKESFERLFGKFYTE